MLKKFASVFLCGSVLFSCLMVVGCGGGGGGGNPAGAGSGASSASGNIRVAFPTASITNYTGKDIFASMNDDDKFPISNSLLTNINAGLTDKAASSLVIQDWIASSTTIKSGLASSFRAVTVEPNKGPVKLAKGKNFISSRITGSSLSSYVEPGSFIVPEGYKAENIKVSTLCAGRSIIGVPVSSFGIYNADATGGLGAPVYTYLGAYIGHSRSYPAESWPKQLNQISLKPGYYKLLVGGAVDADCDIAVDLLEESTSSVTADSNGPSIALTWNTKGVDIDLHVVEPQTEDNHVYFDNKFGKVGRLDMDNIFNGYKADVPEEYFGRPENYYFLTGTTNRVGEYKVYLHYYGLETSPDNGATTCTVRIKTSDSASTVHTETIAFTAGELGVNKAVGIIVVSADGTVVFRDDKSWRIDSLALDEDNSNGYDDEADYSSLRKSKK